MTSMNDQHNGRGPGTRPPLSPSDISELKIPFTPIGANGGTGMSSLPQSSVDPLRGHMNAFELILERLDKEKSKNWSVAADNIMVFTGLFSATVASFLTISYSNLSPDNSERTVILLGWISRQLAQISNGTAPASPLQLSLGLDELAPNLQPSWSGVVVNALWAASLSITLTCALLATLVKQWTQRRIQDVDRAHGWRSFMFFANDEYVSLLTVAVLPIMIHLSIVLFFVGFVIFLFVADHNTSWSLVGVLALCSFVYFFFIFSSLRSRSVNVSHAH